MCLFSVKWRIFGLISLPDAQNEVNILIDSSKMNFAAGQSEFHYRFPPIPPNELFHSPPSAFI